MLLRRHYDVATDVTKEEIEIIVENQSEEPAKTAEVPAKPQRKTSAK